MELFYAPKKPKLGFIITVKNSAKSRDYNFNTVHPIRYSNESVNWISGIKMVTVHYYFNKKNNKNINTSMVADSKVPHSELLRKFSNIIYLREHSYIVSSRGVDS